MTRNTKLNLALFAAWFALVLFQALHHALWRDEVRALSLALRGDTVVEMFKGLRGDGHPALWHLLLRAAHAVIGAPQVLPVLALLVATGAVALLIFRSPFPRPVVAALAFSALFSFEYAVMARNYGLSALLLFLIAEAYKTHREKGVLLGALLFLLANTNVFGALMTGAFLLFWLLDIFSTPDAARKNFADSPSTPASPRSASRCAPPPSSQPSATPLSPIMPASTWAGSRSTRCKIPETPRSPSSCTTRPARSPPWSCCASPSACCRAAPPSSPRWPRCSAWPWCSP